MSQNLKRYLRESVLPAVTQCPITLRTQKVFKNWRKAVLPEALQTVRSLLCTATNATAINAFRDSIQEACQVEHCLIF